MTQASIEASAASITQSRKDEAGVAVPYRMVTPVETATESWKFTTRNGGTSIRLRGDDDKFF